MAAYFTMLYTRNGWFLQSKQMYQLSAQLNKAMHVHLLFSQKNVYLLKSLPRSNNKEGAKLLRGVEAA